MSDAIPLPQNPSLEQYKKQAKELLKTRRMRATAQIEKLADAQRHIARAHGFESWPKFAKHIAALQRHDSRDSMFETAADAIVAGDIETLRPLLGEQPSLVRARSARAHHATLLHYVSANGVEDFRQKTPPNIVDIARFLLDSGADVNAESQSYGDHDTTLMLVATSVHPERAGVQIELMRLLIDRGARIDDDAVFAAVANGRLAAAALLAALGARIDLHSAAALGRVDVLESLLDRDANVNEVDTTGMTPLHRAAEAGQLATVEFLLARGAALELPNRYGGTVLGQTVWSAVHERRPGHLDTIRRLVVAGAEVDEDWFTGPAEISAALGVNVARAADDSPLLARIRDVRTEAERARRSKRFDDAYEMYAQAVALCRQQPDRLLLAHTVRHLGDVEIELPRLGDAQVHLEEAVAIYRSESPSPLELANAIRSLAILKEKIGALGDAKTLWREAHDLYVKANVPPGIEEAARRGTD